MGNCGGRSTVWKGFWKRLVIAGTGISVLCCAGCQSTRTVSDRTVNRETVRLRQEVILLPETERLVISEEAIRKLPTGHSIRSHPDNKATDSGITLTKQADGLIDIECRRDTVRIRNDTVDESVREDVLLVEKVKPGSHNWLWAFLISIGLFLLVKREK